MLGNSYFSIPVLEKLLSLHSHVGELFLSISTLGKLHFFIPMLEKPLFLHSHVGETLYFSINSLVGQLLYIILHTHVCEIFTSAFPCWENHYFSMSRETLLSPFPCWGNSYLSIPMARKSWFSIPMLEELLLYHSSVGNSYFSTPMLGKLLLTCWGNSYSPFQCWRNPYFSTAMLGTLLWCMCNRVYCIHVPGHDPITFSFRSFSFLIGWGVLWPNYLRC